MFFLLFLFFLVVLYIEPAKNANRLASQLGWRMLEELQLVCELLVVVLREAAWSIVAVSKHVVE